MSSDLPAAKCTMAGSWDGPREAFGSQNVLRIVNHKLVLALPSTTARIKSCASAAADLQHPLKEFRVGSRHEALCVPGTLV